MNEMQINKLSLPSENMETDENTILEEAKLKMLNLPPNYEVGPYKCVCAIVSSNSYDTSIFPNNEKSYYTQVTYQRLDDLTALLSNTSNADTSNVDTSNADTSNADTTNANAEPKTKTTDMNMLYVLDCFKNPDIQMIFRFMCSPDCNDGKNFIEEKITEEVYKFVNLVTKHNVIIEVSDHSMGSFFNKWNDSIMLIPKPIEIKSETTSGPFKIFGSKSDFLSSSHPTLKQIGDMSSVDLIEITFNNMGGTKIFSIPEPEKVAGLKIISNGKPLLRNLTRQFNKQVNIEPEVETVTEVPLMPVHCEFDYGMGKIVVSATHWCNLDQVESPIDLNKLRRYCTDTLGAEATEMFEYSLSTMNAQDMKREISSCIRGISSGGGVAYKKQKNNSKSDSFQYVNEYNEA